MPRPVPQSTTTCVLSIMTQRDTFVQETLRNHKGHELTIVEHIRAEGVMLVLTASLGAVEILPSMKNAVVRNGIAKGRPGEDVGRVMRL